MSRDIYDKVKEYNGAVKARFCMPGHSGVDSLDALYSSAAYDWTEVNGLDNLLYSDGVIANCEKKLAKNYGYENSLMLTSGSTCGMLIAMAVARSGRGVSLAIGNMHKSFFASARIVGEKIRCCNNLREAEELSSSVKISCVFVTCPDYFGRLKPLKEIKEFALRMGALLVIDEAHSAHFPYSSLLPDNASKYADIALASMHKTLPVYGGGALVLTNGEDVYMQCRALRADIHTTSPNYLIMASMDYADDYMARRGEEEYAKVKRSVDRFKTILKVGEVVETDDFSRLVVKIDGVDCGKICDALAAQGVYAEMSYGDLLVFIVTPFNCDKLDLLASLLNTVSQEKLESEVDADFGMQNVEKLGDVVLVMPDCALGKVCAVDIGIYPPGTPVIKKGDVINQKAIDFIKKYSSRLFGLACGKVPMIE